MQLSVHVIEARGLRALDPDELSKPYARLQLGKHRLKTQVIKKTINPVWEEEFCFWVGNLHPRKKLTVSVLDDDGDKLLGQLEVPLQDILDSDTLSLGNAWYELKPKRKSSKNRVCGEIRLEITLLHSNSFDVMPNGSHISPNELTSYFDNSSLLIEGVSLSSSSSNAESPRLLEVEVNKPATEDKSNATPVVDREPSLPPASIRFDRLRQILLGRNREPSLPANKDIGSSKELCNDVPENIENFEKQNDNECSNLSFDELVKVMESKEEGGAMPENLPGGVLLDKSYAVTPKQMNSLLFSPTSEFFLSLSELQGTTGLQVELWRPKSEGENLERVLTYIKAASKLIKAMKAIEEQSYIKADGKSYAVLASVSTPEAPFGSYFRTEILYCITPGPDLSPEDSSCRLLISWRMNFLQTTMMKSMIENGARQGLTEGFTMFAEKLSQYAKPVDKEGSSSSKEQILALLQTEQESAWTLSFQVFGNFTFMFCAFIGFYILIHILVKKRSMGLEFFGIDLPDSFGEVLVCGLLILQGQHVWNKIRRFFHARKQGGKDHGVKAQGDGWILTVALIEGRNIRARDQSGSSAPYVVFTCNGKTRTSSIKFQTTNPQWNEIFEFDATYDPPSRMEMTVYDFDQSFDEAIPLGYSEVNFVKSNLSDLANVWIPLQGKSAQACKSKLHLRLFLDNTKGNEVVIEYLTKMGKEVGKKMNLRSPQTHLAFQKLFGLPTEEFLINDYTCYLKRKMPLQGRLFLSPRIIGFYANLFGHKTKFFLLWEDIEDIQFIPPSLASGCSPSLKIILYKGRGGEARHGAKAADHGRLKFHFQSFVSFDGAYRTIKALWKARFLSPEQKVEIVEESDPGSLQTDENGSFLGVEDASMSEVLSSCIPVSAKSLMEIFEGGSLEHKLMKKMGCLGYSVIPWQSIKPDVYQRQISYKLDKSVFSYGVEVTSTQQKSCSADRNGWFVEETLLLCGLLLADHYSVQLKYQIESPPVKPTTCSIHVFLGISWLKSTRHQKRITKNVMSQFTYWVKALFIEVQKEFVKEK